MYIHHRAGGGRGGERQRQRQRGKRNGLPLVYGYQEIDLDLLIA
jgi:hypothetical protein